MKSKTPIVDASARHIYGPEEFIEARIARQLETELAEKNELLMKTNHVHIENQRLQKALNGELETNQRLTDELADARAEIERLNKNLRLLLCKEHLRGCEAGLFNSRHADDEPCLMCLMEAAERGGK